METLNLFNLLLRTILQRLYIGMDCVCVCVCSVIGKNKDFRNLITMLSHSPAISSVEWKRRRR